MRMWLIVLALILAPLSSYALVDLEIEGSRVDYDRDGGQGVDGYGFRLGASFGLTPFVDIDGKIGYASGESGNVTNLSGINEPEEKFQTHYYGVGVSTKPLNWIRAGAGLMYKIVDYKANATTITNTVNDKDSDLGYYLDLGLYHVFSVVGVSLTYSLQKSGDYDMNMINAGLIIRL